MQNNGKHICKTIGLFFAQVIASIQSNCDKITNATLLYKTTTSTKFHFIHLRLTDDITEFVVEGKAEYEIQLVVENNEGYTSSSNIHRVIVKGTFSCK